MNNEPKSAQIEQIYSESGQWLRMVNSIIWAMGSLFVPIAFSCVWLAISYPKGKYFFASGSIFLYAFWVHISALYRQTSIVTREVLMEIEKEWGVRPEMSLYTLQGQIGKKRAGLFNTKMAGLFLLIIIWVVLLFFYRH